MKNKKKLFVLLIIMTMIIGMVPTNVKADAISDSWASFQTKLNSILAGVPGYSATYTSNSVTVKSEYVAANYDASSSPIAVGTNTSTSVSFSYNTTNGVITLNFVDPTNPSEAQVNAKAVTYVMEAVAGVKGYNADKFLTYMYKGYEDQVQAGRSSASFNATGLNLSVGDYVYIGNVVSPATGTGDGVILSDKDAAVAGATNTRSLNAQIKVLFFKSLSVDLVNGVSSYNESSIIYYTNVREAIIGLCVFPISGSTPTTTPTTPRPTPTVDTPTPSTPPTPASNKINVPNTASFISDNSYIIATILLVLGSIVIGKTVLKKNK